MGIKIQSGLLCGALSLAGQTVSVLDLGARPDGTNSAATTAAFAAAFQMAPQGLIRVPAGNYAIDNGNGAFTVNGFSGELHFEGGARLVFQNSQNGGIWFVGGAEAKIRGMRIAYQIPPTSRNSPQEGIKFDSTTDTILSDVTVENSPAAGILFYNSIRPRVTSATVLQSMADGLHFANCQDPQVNGLTTSNTGDDGLAFVNYSQYTDRNGGVATNIVIRTSQARGISVVGPSDVVISDFLVDGTASSGVLCGQDASYGTRSSARVLFSNGLIRNAGTVSPAVGNNYGIEYSGQQSCSFTNIAIDASAGRGVAGMSPQGRVHIANVRVSGNTQNEAFSFYQTASVEIESSSAQNAPGYGFYFGECTTVIANGLSAVNTSMASPLSRAVWFENNQRVLASGISVIDSQQTATGFVVGGVQNGAFVQNGSVSGISGVIDNGALAVVNSSLLRIGPVL